MDVKPPLPHETRFTWSVVILVAAGLAFTSSASAATSASTSAAAPSSAASGTSVSAFSLDTDAFDVSSLDQLQRDQAAFYRESTRKLKSAHTVDGWALDNLASIAGWFTAVVALVSLALNTRATAANFRLSIENSNDERQAELDTQFYEALKRFGDKDSAAIRAGAAALISQICRRTLDTSRTYLDVALDQFPAALRLETEPVALESIVNAIGALAGTASNGVAVAQELVERLHPCNVAIQGQLVTASVTFLLLAGERLDNVGRWTSKAIVQIAARTGFRPYVSAQLLSRGIAPPVYESEIAAVDGMVEEKRIEQRFLLAQSLESIGHRLRNCGRAMEICLRALTTDVYFAEGSRRTLSPRAPEDLSENTKVTQQLEGVFLPESRLTGVDLSGANLRNAMLQYANFHKANLEGAILCRARLAGAALPQRLSDADLSEADLTDTDVSQTDLTLARLSGANWWNAEFDVFGGSLDRDYIDKLFTMFGSDIKRGTRRSGNPRSIAGQYISEKLATL